MNPAPRMGRGLGTRGPDSRPYAAARWAGWARGQQVNKQVMTIQVWRIPRFATYQSPILHSPRFNHFVSFLTIIYRSNHFPLLHTQSCSRADPCVTLGPCDAPHPNHHPGRNRRFLSSTSLRESVCASVIYLTKPLDPPSPPTTHSTSFSRTHPFTRTRTHHHGVPRTCPDVPTHRAQDGRASQGALHPLPVVSVHRASCRECRKTP